MPRETNDVSDIEGAAPAQRWTRWEKPNLFTTRDIEGAQPKKLHVKRNNKPDSSSTADIDDAKPRIKVFRTKRVVNPLNPEYELPQAKLAPMQEPRFLRDSMDVSDLPGARPKTYGGRRPGHEQDALRTTDIPGATQATSFMAYKSLQRREITRYALDVQDIVSKRKRTNRTTDPLRPVYFVNNLRIMDSPRSRPRSSIVSSRKASGRALRTEDIPGAQAGSALNKERLQRELILKEEIAGSHADSLQRGLVTKRPPTNPLQPTYRGLDGETVRCSTAPAKWGRRPAPDAAAVARASLRDEELRRPSTQEGLSSMIESVFAMPRPATACGTTGSSSQIMLLQQQQQQQEHQHGSSKKLLTQSTAQMIPVDMSDAAVTISLQRKVVLKDARVEDDAAAAAAATVAAAAAARAQMQGSGFVKIRAGTPRVKPLARLQRRDFSEAVRVQRSVAQERAAVANLPDTLSASSCLFPNRTRVRKQHK
ncbi:Hypothetical Protein FCC1311_013962 [Hondaea fermentalgiana]|uniref:Uncharacterized protein n=1 Tax=Hondaea fermentalgiana TaxID=2315210 RepID=A0A2R5G4E5_9STRA|nr:Hypothetical Protein FCC1311_013962 [Hondaea fermentalgiana]|eukprot:GBG25179.1 Hypothetical Protein FCC1311_013962 [Hondaea fermentalgiana]